MKMTLNHLLRSFALIIVLPVFLSCWVSSRFTSADSALETHSQWMSLVPGKIGNYLRNAFYRLTLKYCDPTATICFGVLISKTAASLGANVYVGPRCMLGWVTLEDDVLLGPGVQVLSGSHAHGIDCLEIPIRNQPGQLCRVTIGADSWIGAASVVLADVGSQSIVGANSTVTKPVHSQTVVAGSPARPIADRKSSSIEPTNVIEKHDRETIRSGN